jgi:Replication-relaxation
VELPGAADLTPCWGRPGWSVLLLPDLGTAPVGRYRALVRRLLGLRAAEDDPRTAEPVLAIARPDPDGRGGRAAAWLRLLAEVAAQQQEPPPRSRVLTWEQVAALGWSGPAAGRPPTSRQQLLDLVGRHPCLSLGQLAELLGTSRRRAARLRDELVARGWLRLIPAADIPAVALARLKEEPRARGLAELTPLGRRVLAGWLGLSGPAAAHHHGLSGGRDWAGHRQRLLRTLSHTLGTNDVFVALATAARQAAARGQDEALEEWRSAAACERRLCKPDGYGRYRRGRATLGFFLEYDRATERAARYAAKFDAYYRYRASRQAERDYAGFPPVLVVTTGETAEHRIAEAAARAWARHGGPPLAVFVTRIELIAGQPDGLLGPVWRAPYEHDLAGGRRRLLALAAPAGYATEAQPKGLLGPIWHSPASAARGRWPLPPCASTAPGSGFGTSS